MRIVRFWLACCGIGIAGALYLGQLNSAVGCRSSGCAKAASSIAGNLFGIPTSLLGVLAYLIIAITAAANWQRFRRYEAAAIILFWTVSAGLGVYLRMFLQEWCVGCMLSLVVMTGCLVTRFLEAKDEPSFHWRSIVPAFGLMLGGAWYTTTLGTENIESNGAAIAWIFRDFSDEKPSQVAVVDAGCGTCRRFLRSNLKSSAPLAVCFVPIHADDKGIAVNAVAQSLPDSLRQQYLAELENAGSVRSAEIADRFLNSVSSVDQTTSKSVVRRNLQAIKLMHIRRVPILLTRDPQGKVAASELPQSLEIPD